MADAELEHGGFVRTLKDLFAGAAGGVAQVLLGESMYFIFYVLLLYHVLRLFYSESWS